MLTLVMKTVDEYKKGFWIRIRVLIPDKDLSLKKNQIQLRLKTMKIWIRFHNLEYRLIWFLL